LDKTTQLMDKYARRRATSMCVGSWWRGPCGALRTIFELFVGRVFSRRRLGMSQILTQQSSADTSMSPCLCTLKTGACSNLKTAAVAFANPSIAHLSSTHLRSQANVRQSLTSKLIARSVQHLSHNFRHSSTDPLLRTQTLRRWRQVLATLQTSCAVKKLPRSTTRMSSCRVSRRGLPWYRGAL
jgi:hypothetical protein